MSRHHVSVGRDKGQWWGLKWGTKRSAMLRCPDCGLHAHLREHTISNEGVVMPSVVCPEDTCGFHEFLVLDGWEAVV